MKSFALFSLLCALSVTTYAASAINDKESKAAFDAVNDHRVGKGLLPIPFSLSMYNVAKAHVKDDQEKRIENCCGSLHSWSDCCISCSPSDWGCMWQRPSIVTKGIYTGNGFENAARGYTTGAAAAQGWINSCPHEAVITNSQCDDMSDWSRFTWSGMGIAVGANGYSYLWVGSQSNLLEGVEKAKAHADKIKIQWYWLGVNPDEFHVHMREWNDDTNAWSKWGRKKVRPSSERKYTYKNLSPNTKYKFRVREVKDGVRGSWRSVSATTKDD
eukprot:TRINITY_DN8798_c0_g1_i1.p1 TRINITY_DN8798_c0_g1~~TRINITY_DN8798_c0_g1_i1.p1  ORF type:complete len:318 (+),score=22.37 TRINITY_DN8798_c0_g1_i1:139-954(+)